MEKTHEIDVIAEKHYALEKIFEQYQSHVAEHIKRHDEEIEDLYQKQSEISANASNLTTLLTQFKGDIKLEISELEKRLVNGTRSMLNNRNKNWQNWIIVIIQILTFIMIFVK